MIRNIIALSLAAAAVAACAPPIESVSTRLDAASRVELVNAPEGAHLRIGDRDEAARKGNAVLNVADGWHDVEVVVDGRTVHSQRVFVQDGTRRVIDFSAL